MRALEKYEEFAHKTFGDAAGFLISGYAPICHTPGTLRALP